MNKKKFVLIGFVVVLIPVGWFVHKPALKAYYLWRLQRAAQVGDHDFSGLAALGEAAVDPIVEMIRSGTADPDFAATSLTQIIEQLPQDDPRVASIGHRLVDAYSSIPVDRQWIIVEQAEPLARRGARDDSLRLIDAGLSHNEPRTRIRAISFAAKTEFGDLARIVPLIADSKLEVRRAAFTAVASRADVTSEVKLMPLLHEADDDLRRQCEHALRQRGWTDKDMRLGRMASHPSPLKRLEVIRLLPDDADIDPEIWLRKLTDDSSPLVRASAARAAMDPTSPLGVNLSDRVRQMAQADPDGTVRQIADYLIRAKH